MLLYHWWFSSEIQIKLIDPLVSVIKDKNLESEDADEDMWVPSDLVSESEPDEEDGEEKMDEGDSGGEFSSEGGVSWQQNIYEI